LPVLMTIKQVDSEVRKLIDTYLETHEATQLPAGATALVNNVPKKKSWGGKAQKETEEPTTLYDDKPKPRRGRPSRKSEPKPEETPEEVI
jgi:hypothetical protein